MSICSRCGANVRESQKFCTKCGAKIAEVVKPKIPPELAARADIIEKRIAQDTLNPALYIELGDAYHEHGLSEEALVQYQKAATIDKTSAEAHLKSGNIYLASGKPDRARECYQKALVLKPDSLEAKMGLFATLTQLHLVAEATRLGRELLNSAPDALDIRRGLKDLLLAQGRDDEALPELEALAASTPNDAGTLQQLGELYGRKGHVDKALASFQKALALSPKAQDLQLRVGQLLFKAGRYAEAIPHLELAAATEPADLTRIVLLAQALLHEGRFDDAAKAADVIVPASYAVMGQDNRKRLHEVYAAIGERALASGKPSESVGWLETALALHRTSETEKALAKACAAHGRLALNDGELAEAEQLLTRALSLDSANADYNDTLARVRAGQRRRSRWSALRGSLVAALVISVVVAWFAAHGRIMIVLSPAQEAAVTIDDRTPRPVRGWPGAYVSPSLLFGRHMVVVQKDGYEPWQAPVATGWSRTTQVRVALTPIYGSLRLQSVPGGADVTLDGRFLGKTPLSVDTILATRHELRLARAGWLPDTSELLIPARDTLNKCIQLSRVFRDVSISALDAPGAYFEWDYNYDGNRSLDMIDGNLTTFVSVGVESGRDPDQQASLHWLTLSLPDERFVTAVGLAKSYEVFGAHFATVFELRTAEVLFSDGSSQVMELPARSGMQYCRVEPPKKTRQVTIRPRTLQRRGGGASAFGIAEVEVQGFGGEGVSLTQDPGGRAAVPPIRTNEWPAPKQADGGPASLGRVPSLTEGTTAAGCPATTVRNRDADGNVLVANGVSIPAGESKMVSCPGNLLRVYWPSADSSEVFSLAHGQKSWDFWFHRKMAATVE